MSSVADLHSEAVQFVDQILYTDKTEHEVPLCASACVDSDERYIVHNLDTVAPVHFAVCVQKSMTTVGDADEFFARHEVKSPTKLPSLLVFYARSDSRTGRFACSQIVGESRSIAVTIVDDRINTLTHYEDTEDTALVLLVSEMLDLIGPDISHSFVLRSHLRDTARGHRPHKDAVCEVLCDAADLFEYERMIRVNNVLGRLRDNTCLPDAGWVLANLKGASHVVSGTPPGCRAWTCYGGDIALVFQHGGCAPVVHMWSRSALNSRVIVTVDMDVFKIDMTNTQRESGYSITSLQHSADAKRLDVLVRGSSWTHVVHVLDNVVETMYCCRQDIIDNLDWEKAEVIQDWLVSANDDVAEVTVFENERRREWALDAIGKALVRNLGAIKAHLWKPGGRLVQNMMSCHDEQN